MAKLNEKLVYGFLMVLVLGFALIASFSLISAEGNDSGNGQGNGQNDDEECALDSECDEGESCIEGDCEDLLISENEDDDEEDVEEVEIESEEEIELQNNESKKYKYHYKYENGEEVETEFQYQHDNRWEFRVGNYSAQCSGECNFSMNQSEILVKFSNGKYALIKVMPDTAAEKAIERLKLKVCSEENNCTIELKDVGERANETEEENSTNVAYEVQAEKPAKVFGFINSEMKVKAVVDAETGEVIKVKKAWWAFLASEPEEN
ncbi:MAG: hypothetical protein WC812_02090 [Candidatus Pacearchaeota archaeon]|jgi:hypothetical protein